MFLVDHKIHQTSLTVQNLKIHTLLVDTMSDLNGQNQKDFLIVMEIHLLSMNDVKNTEDN